MFLEKAMDLGRLIGQAEEYKALTRAQSAMESASELKLRFERLEQLGAALERAAEGGGEPPTEDAEEYDRVFGEVQADPRYQQLVAAQANFDKLMLRVQQRIAEGMKKAAESSIITLS